MSKIEDYFNTIGDFESVLGDDVVYLKGVLYYADNRIVLASTLPAKILRAIVELSSICISGKILEKEFALINCIAKTAKTDYQQDCVYVTFEPTDIVMGAKDAQTLKVTSAEMEIPELQWFFSDWFWGGLTDDSQLIERIKHNELSATDSNHEVLITRQVSKNSTRSGLNICAIPVAKVSFIENVSINMMRRYMAKIRTLFLFLSDGYVPLDSITFEALIDDENAETVVKDVIYISNYYEDYDVVNSPFIVTSRMLANDFQTVWSNWCRLYETVPFLSVLFFEVVRNRSTWINAFLNFAQGIDLFENKYRATQIKAIQKQKDKKSNNKYVSIQYILEDALLQVKDYLNLTENTISILSDRLNKFRNFFTHFNEKDYEEPSYEEVFSANRLLRFTYLALIYQKIGLCTDAFSNLMGNSRYCCIQEDIHVLLRDGKVSVNYDAKFSDI